MDADKLDLRVLDDEELFGELRRRKVPDYKVMDALNMRSPRAQHDPSWTLRRWALYALAVLTLALIGIIGWLAINAMEIPDLLSGLAGSGIGAIAGILASGGTSGASTGQPVLATPESGRS